MSSVRSGATLMRKRTESGLRRLGAVAGVAVLTCLCSASRPLSAAGAAAPGMTVQAAAPTAADWTAMRKVIADQRAALKAGDAARAFAYASPAIRRQFGDAATFIGMVRASYAALLSARYTEFLEGATIDGTVIQPLRLIDADSTVRVALYVMERQANGSWRIGGCQIAQSTVQAT
jgi:hypothetical protein